ncbi:MAG TPA: RecQ family ATP-dependent DNA helicase [Thermomicrobiales bacterium]|nr:RecQ family ATP-dependent DNA helicase [Thermomicrobiales bacterium]
MLSQIRESVGRYVSGNRSPATERAHELFRQAFGLEAAFRPGQLDAIRALVDDRARLLVVQRTGWGKSLVYFLATRLLREQGAGPTLLVSPLLALMRNQQQMAERLGVVAESISSANPREWEAIALRLERNEIDLLMISPERLANPDFRKRELPRLQSGIGMLVIDEAHCISDWGHDFRPDYRRIVQIVNAMPASLPVLATTATANDRVVTDIQEQLGQRLKVLRGGLERDSLRLQTIELPSQSQRLAWLATHLPQMPGAGVIYCLTVRDTELVSRFLQQEGIDAPAYHGELDAEVRIDLEQKLIANEIKALCATVALGMGFDKPDLGFVVHYQRPGSVIAYYQQVGRAGRAVDEAYAILLAGAEDDEIQEYFIRSAFPGAQEIVQVVHALDEADGLTQRELEQRVNLSHSRIEKCLKFLEVEGAIVREGNVFSRTPLKWAPDVDRWRRVTEIRQSEMQRMREFVRSHDCLMQFVIRELDDRSGGPCGRCANCNGPVVAPSFDERLVERARRFLGRQWIPIEPRKQLPAGILPERPKRTIEEMDRVESGLALCAYKDEILGRLVRVGKYRIGRFDDRLVVASAEAIQATWPIDRTWWIVPVPSRRHPELVRDFAMRLAANLGVDCVEALIKVRDTAEQKTMENSYRQCENMLGAFRADPELVRSGPVLLVDDLVDSRWTLTICGERLRKRGSGPVYPFILASQRKGDEA